MDRDGSNGARVTSSSSSVSAPKAWVNPLNRPGPSKPTALPPRPAVESDLSDSRPLKRSPEAGPRTDRDRSTDTRRWEEKRRSKSPAARDYRARHEERDDRATGLPHKDDSARSSQGSSHGHHHPHNQGRSDRYDGRDYDYAERDRDRSRDRLRTDRYPPRERDRHEGYESDWEKAQRRSGSRYDDPPKRKYDDRDRSKDRWEDGDRHERGEYRERTSSGRYRDSERSPRREEGEYYKRRRRSSSRSRSRDRDRDRDRDWDRDRDRDRRRTYSSRRERTPTPEEEGEIAEEGEIEPSPPAPAPMLGSQGEGARSVSASDQGTSYQPIKIKNRPTKRISDVNVFEPPPPSAPVVIPPPAPAVGQNGHTRPPTPTLPAPPPPPPPGDRPPTPPTVNTPPPPPDHPPTPPPPPVVSTKRPGTSSYQPRAHKVLETGKVEAQGKYDEHGDRIDGQKSVPHAPNRNLLNPNTRPSTPAAKTGSSASHDTGTRLFSRPTAEEELRNFNKAFVGTTTLAAYDLGDKLGEGTFGVVTKGVEIATKRAIALKKLITHNPRDGVSVTTVREIKILKALNHPNIVEIIDMVVERENPSDRSRRGDVFMVFPYMDHDLCGLLSNADFKISHSINKLFMRQILQGMDYIHANNFIHRDIKTANILVDRRGEIKIADFGLARTWTFDELMPKHLATEYTNMVVTRWYRAPELLLGERHYGPAIDMWSVGCVLGEMYHRLPILQGESDRDQLFKIFGKIERPTEETFPGWDRLPGFPDSPGYAWDKVPEDQPLLATAQRWSMERGGADLMMQLLRLDPIKRLTAHDALDHPWFWTSPKPAVCSNGLITVDSSHEMTQKIRNDPPRRVQQPIPAHRPRQSFPNQHQHPQSHQQQAYPHHSQQQHQVPWNGHRPMPQSHIPIQAQMNTFGGGGQGAMPVNPYSGTGNTQMQNRPRQSFPNQHQQPMGANGYGNGNLNGHGHGPGFPNRPQAGFGNGHGHATGPPPGLPPRPPTGSNPYVPPAPFALAPSRNGSAGARPPAGPRNGNGNGPLPGMGGNGNRRPPGAMDPSANMGSKSAQNGLPY